MSGELDERHVDEMLEAHQHLVLTMRMRDDAVEDAKQLNFDVRFAHASFGGYFSTPELRTEFIRWADDNVVSKSRTLRRKALVVRSFLDRNNPAHIFDDSSS